MLGRVSNHAPNLAQHLRAADITSGSIWYGRAKMA